MKTYSYLVSSTDDHLAASSNADSSSPSGIGQWHLYDLSVFN